MAPAGRAGREGRVAVIQLQGHRLATSERTTSQAAKVFLGTLGGYASCERSVH